jgi:hypothetical protein
MATRNVIKKMVEVSFFLRPKSSSEIVFHASISTELDWGWGS